MTSQRPKTAKHWVRQFIGVLLGLLAISIIALKLAISASPKG